MWKINGIAAQFNLLSYYSWNKASQIYNILIIMYNNILISGQLLLLHWQADVICDDAIFLVLVTHSRSLLVGLRYKKVHPIRGYEEPEGEQRYSSTLSLALALDGGGWSTPLFYPRARNLVPILQETEWASGPVWTRTENFAPPGVRTPDRPARNESLHQLRYPGRRGYVICIYDKFVSSQLIILASLCGSARFSQEQQASWRSYFCHP
jgi:hypothetical protein